MKKFADCDRNRDVVGFRQKCALYMRWKAAEWANKLQQMQILIFAE